MKNKINISNLSLEQIEDLRQQLKAFDEQPKSIMDKVKSWEDAVELNKNIRHYFIHRDAAITKCGLHVPPLVGNKNIVPSEKHAKSILATCQLMVIAEALNEGNKDNRISVHLINEELRALHYQENVYKAQILFKNIPTGEYAITQFPDLWYDYFMIDKPTKTN